MRRSPSARTRLLQSLPQTPRPRRADTAPARQQTSERLPAAAPAFCPLFPRSGGWRGQIPDRTPQAAARLRAGSSGTEQLCGLATCLEDLEPGRPAHNLCRTASLGVLSMLDRELSPQRPVVGEVVADVGGKLFRRLRLPELGEDSMVEVEDAHPPGGIGRALAREEGDLVVVGVARDRAAGADRRRVGRESEPARAQRLVDRVARFSPGQVEVAEADDVAGVGVLAPPPQVGPARDRVGLETPTIERTRVVLLAEQRMDGGKEEAETSGLK